MFISLGAGSPAYAVSIFQEIDVQTGDEGTTIRIEFAGRVRLQSHTPAERGSELRVLFRVLSEADFDPDALFGRETRGWPSEEPHPLRSLTFDGTRASGPQITLQFERAVSFSVRTTPDLQTLVIFIEPEAVREPPPPAEKVIKQKPKAVFRRRVYVVYLLSSREPIDLEAIKRIPEFAGKELFSAEATVKGVLWNRLALGYFETAAEARQRVQAVRKRYPGAWIGTLEIEEKRAVAAPAPVPEGEERIRQLMSAGRKAMIAGEYAKAAQIYTEVLESPHPRLHQEALELLGLARERNGQYAHAIAEYEEYLRRYPEGKDAERVRQRLAGLVTARPTEREREVAAAPPERKKPAVRWDWFGSLSQEYLRDETVAAPTDTEEEVRQSTLTTFFTTSARRRGPDYDLRVRATGQHQKDTDDVTANSDEEEVEITDLNLEVTNRKTRTLGRIGRQRYSGAGILGRFDGALLSVPVSDRVTVNGVLGHPVDLSEKTTVQTDKTFLGLSANFGPYAERWNFNAFAIEQRAEDFIDRQAVGGEVRYFTARQSLFALVDYDTLYEDLNSLLFLGNWTLSDKQTLYLTVDHRFSPTLTTSNALISQPVTSLEELSATLSEEEIRQLALDRSARTTALSLGGSRQLTKDLQVSLDVTVSETDGTPASGDVPATEATGEEYFYTLQFVGTNYFRENDTAILSLRVGDTAASDLFALSVDSRRPLFNRWRLNPRFLLDYREQKETPDTSLRLRPSLRFEYQGWRKLEFHSEIGIDWLEEDDGTTKENSAGYFFNIGYRWDY